MALTFTLVKSSNILGLRFEPGARDDEGELLGRLIVQFRDDAVYAYDDVPEWKYESALDASSVGSYIHNMVIRQYRCWRLVTEAEERY